MKNEEIYRFYSKGFRNDEPTEEARRQRVLDVVKSAMPEPMGADTERLMMQTIENPELFLTNDVQVFRDQVERNGHCYDQPDLPKCSSRAAEHRSEGNRFYAKKEYGDAIKKYNESICSAPNDSEDLGMGYANRSAVFYNVGDYVLALANITLAKRYNYPERLMSKLTVREANCKQAIDSKKPETKLTTASGLNRNPFLSDSICVRKLPIFNNSLVARKDFKAGDLIIKEKPMMVTVNLSHIFVRCNHCASENLFHLIPCPNCVSAMFCNEECLQNGQAMHRFECGITGQLSKLTEAHIGSRMFFHGLALFDDDVNKMMDFCRTGKATECTFLDIDYTKKDPLKEFEIFLAIKPGENALLDTPLRLTAAIVHAMLLKVPSVRALITTRAQEDFMLQCFTDFLQKTATMSVRRSQNRGFLSSLYPLASLCNHSCDPNAIAFNYGGQLKMVTLRPIRRGEQICISYGAHFKQDDSQRPLELMALGFKCLCDVCDEQKHQKFLAANKQDNAIPLKAWTTMEKLMTDDEFTEADRNNALQQFVQRHASVHPQDDYANVLGVFRIHLKNTYTLEMTAVMQARIAG